MENSRKNKMNSSYWLLALFLILIIQSVYQNYRDVQPVPYSEIEKSLEKGKIKQVVISDKTITAELKSPESGKKAIVANRVETDLVERLSKFNVPYTRVIDSTFLKDVLSWVLPTLFFFGIWFFVFRKFAEKQMGSGGFLNIGKTKAKVFVETDTGVNFTDVAGVDEAKQELSELVDFLKNKEEYGRLGAKIPKGVLLVGPPGTGKTLLAKAVAGEAKVPFFSISGSEFIEMFVGVGAARVRDLFEQARKQSPAIIFVDELDALGKARSAAGGMGGHDEREQTLNQLLVEMDGFDATQGLIILAATNRPEILDPALLRAGRFDRQVLVDRPDKIGRIQILKVHIKKVQIADDIDLEKIAALTAGFSGADLANLVNEAALAATRRKASKVELEDFTYAIERIIAGLEKKNRVLSEKEKTIVAYHEMGHALVAKAIDGSDPVHKISIIPRGIGALGYTLQRPTEDRFIMEKEELEAKICVLLGGRAAELLKFSKLTTGASDDIQKATDIAREMITKYGMAEELGFVAYEKQRHTFLSDFTSQLGRNLSEATLSKIDELTKKLIDECFSKATSILKKNFNILEESSQELLKKETLDEEDLVKLTKNMIRVE